MSNGGKRRAVTKKWLNKVSLFLLLSGMFGALYIGIAAAVKQGAGIQIDGNWTIALGLISGAASVSFQSSLAPRYLRFTTYELSSPLSASLEKGYAIFGLALMGAPLLFVLRGPLASLQETLALSYLISMAFFMQKFIDMAVLGKPRLLQNHLMVWFFLFLATVQLLYDGLVPLRTASDLTVATFLFVLFLLFYGSASTSIVREKENDLEKVHPQYYLSLAHQGLYSLVLVLVLTLQQAFTTALRVPGPSSFVLVIGALVLLVVIPFPRQYLGFVRKVRELRKSKEGRRFLLRAQKDHWQTDIRKSSAAAGFAGSLSFAISIGAFYVGLGILFLSIETSQIGYALQGISLVFMSWSGLAYGFRRRGTLYAYSKAMRRLNLWRVESSEQLKNSFGLLSRFYLGMASILFGIDKLVTLPSYLVLQIYVLLFVSVSLGVLLYWIQTNSFEGGTYDDKYLSKMRTWLNILSFPVWAIVGRATGIMAVALEVPPLVDSFLTAAVTLALVSLQLYFSYLRGKGIRRPPGAK